MLSKIYRLTICFFLLQSGLSAAPVILLSNYTFAPNRSEVGEILVKDDAAIISIGLTGPNGRKFRVGNKNRLYLVGGYNSPEIKWVDITIKVKTKKGSFSNTFRIVNDQFIQNRVIAHRGAWKNTGATENSVASLQNAISLGCAGSEFDVHLSADSVIFIHHDPIAEGLTIEKEDSAHLSAIKLANGETLPTLQQYLEAGIGQNHTKLILEIKPSLISKARALVLTERVIQLVREYKAQAWVDYISFDYDVCKKVQELDPYAKVAYLNGDKSPEELAKDRLTGLDYHFRVLQEHENWIDEAFANGLTVNVWTVNDETIMKGFLDHKVTFITTNEPEILLKMIK